MVIGARSSTTFSTSWVFASSSTEDDATLAVNRAISAVVPGPGTIQGLHQLAQVFHLYSVAAHDRDRAPGKSVEVQIRTSRCTAAPELGVAAPGATRRARRSKESPGCSVLLRRPTSKKKRTTRSRSWKREARPRSRRGLRLHAQRPGESRWFEGGDDDRLSPYAVAQPEVGHHCVAPRSTVASCPRYGPALADVVEIVTSKRRLRRSVTRTGSRSAQSSPPNRRSASGSSENVVRTRLREAARS